MSYILTLLVELSAQIFAEDFKYHTIHLYLYSKLSLFLLSLKDGMTIILSGAGVKEVPGVCYSWEAYVTWAMGWTFDDLEESTRISEEVHQISSIFFLIHLYGSN